MEINKKCHNCAEYRSNYTKSICDTCWRCSNWRPDAKMQALINRAMAKESQNLTEYKLYVKEGIAMGKTTYNHYFRNGDSVKTTTKIHFTNGNEMDIRDNIKDVIFNDPATIILWKDGSKTVVKTQDVEAYDPEKGFAMAIAKKVLGGQGNYYEVFKKWVPDVDVVANTVQFELKLMPDLSAASKYIHEIQKKLYENLHREDKTEE